MRPRPRGAKLGCGRSCAGSTRVEIRQYVARFYELRAQQLKDAVGPTLELTRGADLIIHHAMDVNGLCAARVHRRPRATVHLMLGLLPALRAPVAGFALGWLGGLASFITREAKNILTDRSLTPVLRAAGLKPHRRVLAHTARSPWLNLLAISPALVPTDLLWTGDIQQTGYWFLDSQTYTPSPELEYFLASGPPPLVFTFGSTMGSDSNIQTQQILDALQQTGRRAIIQAGWGDFGRGKLPEGVLRIDQVPHDWLFSRARCVIHHGGAGTTGAVARAGIPHGGAGTTGAVARAGIPQVIICHFGDQPAWGRIVHRAGIGTLPVRERRLSATTLTRLIREALSPTTVSPAHQLGPRVRREKGVERRIGILNALFRREEVYEMDLWVVKYASRRSRIGDFSGDSSVRGARICHPGVRNRREGGRADRTDEFTPVHPKAAHISSSADPEVAYFDAARPH